MDGLLRIFQRLRKHLALDVRGGSIGKSYVLRRAVVRKLQRAVVTGNRFSKCTFPPVQDALEKGSKVYMIGHVELVKFKYYCFEKHKTRQIYF